MRLRVAMAALVAVTASGCGALGGSVGPNDWTLIGATPDEQHLLVTTLFGGVSSGCTRWEGWEVDESSDRVEIKALLWTKRFPGGCTDEGITETTEIDLAEPLGDRDLVGCGADDCASGDLSPWLGSREINAVVTPGGVAVATAEGVQWISTDGEVVWVMEGSTGGLLAIADVLVGYDGRYTTGYDPRTGAELWQVEGSTAAAGNGTVYLCRGIDAEIVAAFDAATGAEQWSAEAPCDHVVPGDGVLTIVTGDRTVDGGYELLLVDPLTGDLLLRRVFDDGVDDQVTGFDGAVLAGDRIVIAGQQADLVVLGSDGQELLRRQDGIGRPIGVVDGVVIVAAHDRVVTVDPITGETIWTSQEFTRLSVSVSDDALWSLDASTSSVSRLDPHSGEPLWTAPIGVTNGIDVAANGTVAYVASTLAVIALDMATGELQWWQHLPYDNPSGKD